MRVCVARCKMAHFKSYKGGQKQGLLGVCVVGYFTCFLGGPANGIKRVLREGGLPLKVGFRNHLTSSSDRKYHHFKQKTISLTPTIKS